MAVVGMAATSDSFRALKNEIEKTYLDSEAYLHYIALIHRHYQKRDIQLKWMVAAASCAPVVSKLNQSSATIWPWVLALIPLVSIALPLLDYGKLISSTSSLHEKYSKLVPDIKKLWREVEAQSSANDALEAKIKDTLSLIDNKIAEIRPEKLNIPDIKKFKDKAERSAKITLLHSRSSGGATVSNFSLVGDRL